MGRGRKIGLPDGEVDEAGIGKCPFEHLADARPRNPLCSLCDDTSPIADNSHSSPPVLKDQPSKPPVVRPLRVLREATSRDLSPECRPTTRPAFPRRIPGSAAFGPAGML